MAGRHLATPDDRSRSEAAGGPTPVDEASVDDHLVDPGARISDGTSVTVDLEAMPEHPDVAPSPARPDELVEGGRVGDGTEME